MVSSGVHRLLLSDRDGWFLAIILLVVLLQKTSSSCPEALCDCTKYITYKTIRCDISNLTVVPLGLPADTKTLRLEHNRLTKLAAADFVNLSQLEKLYLYNNHISAIEDGAFRGLSSLVHLDLTSNIISEITNGTFVGAPKLEKLLMRNNRLSDLPRGTFRQAPLLSFLDLASNNLSEFPADVTQDLVNLKVLDLSKNPVTLAPSFGQQLGALEDLRLKSITNNAMGQFPVAGSAFDGLVNLTTIELQENNLVEIPEAVRSLPNLVAIRLGDNFIRNVKDGDFHDPSLLQDLYLDGNSLVEVPTIGLSKLPQLVYLTLDFNSIDTIPARAFGHNTQLQELSLYSAGISSIDKDAFQSLPSLKELWLDNNNLTTIVDGVFDNINPALWVNLAENPLLCDCKLRAFGGWLKNNTSSPKTLECAAPGRLQGTQVVDIEPGDFACRPRLLANTIHSTLATQGTDVSLPCGIEADPTTDIYWITSNHSLVYPHQPKPGFYFLSGSNGTLMATAVSLKDSGSYTCVVNNAAGEMSASITLEVSSRPETPSTRSPTLSLTSGKTGTVHGTAGGVVYGIAGVIIVLVGVLILLATIAVRRNNNHRTGIQGIPLPPTPVRDYCNSELYDEIPGALIDANGYATRININQPTQINLNENTTPADQHIVHTYLDPKCEMKNNHKEPVASLSCDGEKCAVDLSNSGSQRYTTVGQSNPTADQDIVNHTYLDPKSQRNNNNQKKEEVSNGCDEENQVVLDLANDSQHYSTTVPSNQTDYMTMKQLPHLESE